jgi:hypothetical protein
VETQDLLRANLPMAERLVRFVCQRAEDNDVLVITNAASTPEGHDDEHYLLNYRICTEIPLDPPKPCATMLQLFRCGVPDVEGDLGPSCSNTGFP